MKQNVTRRNFLTTAGTAALAAVTGATGAADKPAAKPARPAPAGKAAKGQVIAYYFHRTIRCKSCEDVELQAREVIERRFAVELANKRLLFKTVDFDQPENRAYQQKYKLDGPCLVVARLHDGQEARWKLLDKMWEYAINPTKFDKYVETEVDKFLRDTK
jgi:hypothetical protein